MAIVARMTRRLVALAMTAVLVGCSPGPTVTPGATPGATPAATQGAGGSPRACLATGPPLALSQTWQDRVFYEVFVRSFADSDGDGIGDLAGLTAKLDYLNDGNPATKDDLGVTGLWLMPVAEAASYHGYDVTDYSAVERDYGDETAMRDFVEAAHARGILVIVDLVINHTSREHPWFQDALDGGPHRDWYLWSESNPGWPAVAGPSPWHEAPTGEHYYGAFWEGMPDLNLRNAEVAAEIERVADAWLDLGVDGFRIDAAKHLIEVDGSHQVNTPETLAWLETFSAAVHDAHPEALIVGEVWDVPRIAGAYVPEGADLTFDFGMAGAVVAALQQGRTPLITTALSDTLRAWPTNRHASFLTNHDQNRLLSQLNGDVASARLAAFMLLTGPGVPFIYYGEEIGMQGRKPDERIRTPMQWAADAPAGGFSTSAPWEPLADDWQAVTVAAQANEPESLLSTYRNVIALRAAQPALATGATAIVDGGATSVIGWLRMADETILLTVVNVSAAPVTDYGLSWEFGPLCGTAEATLIASVGDPSSPEVAVPTVTMTGELEAYRPITTLAPRSGYVIQLKGAP